MEVEVEVGARVAVGEEIEPEVCGIDHNMMHMVSVGVSVVALSL